MFYFIRLTCKVERGSEVQTNVVHFFMNVGFTGNFDRQVKPIIINKTLQTK